MSSKKIVYIPPESINTKEISVLDKINRLNELQDPDLMNQDYLQYFANNLGYDININKGELGNLAELSTSATCPDVNVEKYMRFAIRNLPLWYSIKTTDNSIKIMLYSFGLIGDVSQYYTDNYLPESEGGKWVNGDVSQKSYSVSAIPKEFYPTPHFIVWVDLDQSVSNLSWEYEKREQIVNAIESIKPVNTVFRHLGAYTSIPVDLYCSVMTRFHSRYMKLPANGNSDPWVNLYAYVASYNSDALEIIDVSTPSNPTHEGSIVSGDGGALLGSAVSVFVKDNYAYVASYNSDALEIIDISTPTSPTHVGSISNGEGGALLGGARSIFVKDDYAYVASQHSDALEIIDVSTPSSPSHVGSISNGDGGALLNGARSVFVKDDYAYVASFYSNALEIIDISTPISPSHTGSISNGDGGALLSGTMGIFVKDDYAYVVSEKSDALEIIDVSTPSSPSHVGSISNGDGGALLNGSIGIFVKDDYAYVVSLYSNALEIIDVSIPTSPTHVGSISNGDGGALLNTPTSIFIAYDRIT